MTKKLIIFDCDGVLVDSEIITSQVFSETLSNYGYPITIEESIKKFTGVNEESCRELIMKEAGIAIPENYWDLQQPALIKAYQAELIPLLQPVLEVLDSLKIPRCVASNSSRSHIIECLKFTKQLKFFNNSAIFSSQDVLKPKPAPDLFLFAAHKMGADPEDCIVIEDSSTGVHAATAAGMQVLMFLGGKHASFEWYRSQVAIHNKPMFLTCQELMDAIQKF